MIIVECEIISFLTQPINSRCMSLRVNVISHINRRYFSHHRACAFCVCDAYFFTKIFLNFFASTHNEEMNLKKNTFSIFVVDWAIRDGHVSLMRAITQRLFFAHYQSCRSQLQQLCGLMNSPMISQKNGLSIIAQVSSCPFLKSACSRWRVKPVLRHYYAHSECERTRGSHSRTYWR